MSTTATLTETATSSLPKSVPTTFNYFQPPADGSAPYSKADRDPVTGKQDTNWERDSRSLYVEDVRGHESEYTLDTAGFAYHVGPTKMRAEDFNDDETIKRVYYPESEEYLKKTTGAKKVVLFDHTVRRHRPGQIDSGADTRQPVPMVHGDQTAKSAAVRVKRHLPVDEAEEILKSGTRFQIINLWRPIGNPAIDFPLGFCDFRSIDASRDLVPHRIIFATYEGETLNVRYNEKHKWKYLRGQTPDEFALIKCYDSKPDVAPMTAHSAFTDPTTPPDAPKRQSIELRALLFY
ncbi:hypothetical protein EXIGLDRAFT_720392 [Exidia glandulosa HHB12029]|uniref:Methyltransferase n=1 Tax=Exidia glandulosa HHB12029 TaxID=1314781 RepID=A0A165NHE0_EXIGL|nr:hypothetical protein EXIGLDRAFT_720392 [Exidia glandulosa HHB12029]